MVMAKEEKNTFLTSVANGFPPTSGIRAYFCISGEDSMKVVITERVMVVQRIDDKAQHTEQTVAHFGDLDLPPL